MKKHSADRYRVYSTYTRQIADRLGLRDWQIDVRREEHEGGFGQITVWKDNTRADLSLSRHADAVELRDTIVHELLHCYHGHSDQVINDALEQEVPEHVWMNFETHHRRLVERATDQLARAVAAFLPLPPKA